MPAPGGLELGDSFGPAALEAVRGRVPMVRPAAASRLAGLFDWDTLDRVLACSETQASQSEVILVRRSQVAAARTPRSLQQTFPLLDNGWSLVVRHAEHRDANLRALAAAVARQFPGPVEVRLLVNPKGERGFDWRYESEDLFFLQTYGRSDCFFRENTIKAEPGVAADFGAIRREQTPVKVSPLRAGDWLYLPSGWWHTTMARKDSLAIALALPCAREQRVGEKSQLATREDGPS